MLNTKQTTRNAIQNELQTFLIEELLTHQAGLQLEVTDDLLGGGLVDSLGIMRFIAFIESTHGITVPPGDVTIENFRTVETVSRYVEGRTVP